MKNHGFDIRNDRPITYINRYNYGYLSTNYFTKDTLGGEYKQVEPPRKREKMRISNFSMKVDIYDNHEEAKDIYESLTSEDICLFFSENNMNRYIIVEVKMDGILFANSIECEILVAIQKILEIAAEKTKNETFQTKEEPNERDERRI